MAEQSQYDLVVERSKQMREYMLSAVRSIDAMISAMEAVGGAKAPLATYKGVKKGLVILRKKYSEVYKEEFKGLDSASLKSLECLGVTALFDSDLLSKLRATRARMWSKYTTTLRKLTELNKSIESSLTLSTATSMVSTPTLNRYLDQTTKTGDLIAELDQRQVNWDLTRLSEGATGAYQDTLGKHFNGKAHDPIAGATIIDALTDFSTALLGAQYPTATSFCGEDAPISSSQEETVAARRKAVADKKAKAESERISAFMGKSDDIRKTIEDILTECSILVNKIDSTSVDPVSGSAINPNRDVANQFRSRIAEVRGTIPAQGTNSGSTMEYASQLESVLSRAKSLLMSLKNYRVSSSYAPSQGGASQSSYGRLR